MPLYRVFESVKPAPGIFDVVIVDEASQCGPDSLILFYLAKKIDEDMTRQRQLERAQ